MTAHEAVRWRPFVKRGQARRADIRLAPGAVSRVSIWPIAGSVAWGSTARFRTIRPSRRTAMAVFARATFCACWPHQKTGAAVYVASWLLGQHGLLGGGLRENYAAPPIFGLGKLHQRSRGLVPAFYPWGHDSQLWCGGSATGLTAASAAQVRSLRLRRDLNADLVIGVPTAEALVKSLD